MTLAYRTISYLRDNQQPLNLFLKGGVKLGGFVTALDGESLFLTRDGSTQLVFLDAIATVMPDNGFAADIMKELAENNGVNEKNKRSK